MSDSSMNLGTIFTANIADFLAKASTVRNTLNSFSVVTGQLNSKLNTLAASTAKGTTSVNKGTVAVQKATAAQQNYSKQLSGVHGAWNRLVSSMKVTAAYGAAATAIFAVTGALRGGASAIINYDQALMNLSAISGATEAQLEIMSQKILQVATDTKYSGTEVAEGMTLLAQAGFSATESIAAIGATSDLAAGTLSDFKNVTDLMTTSIRAYGLEATDASRVADVMANAINKSKLDVDKLRTAFGYVASSAGMVGMSIEETAASMMVLADHGMKASTVGTGLRQVLSLLMAPTQAVANAVHNAGMTIEQLNPSIVGFQTAMQNLRKILVDDSGVVNMTRAFEMFKLRGAQAAAVIVKSFTDGSFQAALDNTYKVGSAEEMMKTQAEGLGFALKNLGDRAQRLAISLGEAGVAGVIGVVLNSLRSLLGVVTEFSESGIGKFILQVAVWSASLYGVGVAFLALKTLFLGSGLVFWVKNLSAVFGVLTMTMTRTAAAASILKTLMAGNVWGLVAMAIATLGIAFYNWTQRTEKARIAQEQLTEETFQSLNSLKLYQAAILATGGVGKEYESLLQRLKKDHPELAEAVDRNKDSYKDLAEEMERVANLKLEEGLLSQAKTIKILEKEFGTLKESFDHYTTAYGSFLLGVRNESSLEEFVERSSLGAQKLDDIAAAYADFARKVFDSVGGDANEAGVKSKDLLEKMGWSPADVEAGLAKLSDLFVEFEEKRKIAQAELFQERIAKLFVTNTTKHYKDLYSNLSLLDQARLSKVIDNADKELEVYNKQADNLGHTTAQRFAAEGAIRAKARADYEANVHKEEDSAVQSAQRKIKIYEEQLKSEDAALTDQLDKLSAVYDSEVALAEEKGNDVTKITDQYNQAVQEINAKSVLLHEEIKNQIVKEEQAAAIEIIKTHEKTYDAKAVALDKWYQFQDKTEADGLARRIKAIQDSHAEEIAIAELAAEQSASIEKQKNEEVITVVRNKAGQIIGAYNKITEGVVAATETWVEVERKAGEETLEGHSSDVAKFQAIAEKKWNGYLVLEKDAQDRIVAYQQEGSDQITRIVWDENGKIAKAYTDRTALIASESQKAASAEAQAVQQNSTMVAAYRSMYEEIGQEIAASSRDRIAKAAETRDAEREIFRSGLSEKLDVTKETNIMLAETNQKYNERVKEIHQNEVDTWKSLLDSVTDKYREIQGEIIELQKSLVDMQKDNDDQLFDMKIKNLTDYQQYQEKQARYSEMMAKGAALAEQAATAETFEAKMAYLKESSEYYKKAQSLAKDLNTEIKSAGDDAGKSKEIIVSAQQAQENAILKVTAAMAAQEENVKNMIQLKKDEADAVLEQQKSLEAALDDANKKLEEFTKKEWIAEVQVKILGESNVDDLIKKLDSLKDKTVTVTVIEKTEKRSRWGGFVDKVKKFAFGGKLSGYGGGDIVDAKLEPGEFVVRKEGVRNIGTDILYAINNLQLGAKDFVSSVKAKTGGYLAAMPRAMKPVFPKLAMQSGGSVPSLGDLQNFGSLNLSFNDKPVGQIYGSSDVLSQLNQQIQKQTRLRRN